MTLTEGTTVNPHQFLGIDVNARAVAIADLVLWIGYLQWQFRSVGRLAISGPVIRTYKNLECRDAVLDWDAIEPVFDDEGKPVTRWDGRTTKAHPVTGEEVPDETARVQELRYVNPRKAEWPKANYIVGNPPFIGNKRMRHNLSDGYVEALRLVYSSVPKTADYVMYWWDSAAERLCDGALVRFGLITTNSITQSLNRGVLERYISGADNAKLSLVRAIPDHPWVDSADGAAVRIAMTVAAHGRFDGVLAKVDSEKVMDEMHSEVTFQELRGRISPALTVGANFSSLASLKSNEHAAFQGVIPLGQGFVLSAADLESFGLAPDRLPATVRKYVCGRDLVKTPEDRWIIDFYGLSEDEAMKSYPSLYQRVLLHVKPNRDQNKRACRRDNWWLYGENAPKLRESLQDIVRFIGTPDTSKHKPFVFIDARTLPDVGVYAIASDDGFLLGVLSSRAHQSWLDATAPRLEDRPRWKPAIVFAPFPFPDATDTQKTRIRALGEQLDAHRKRQQELHPKLTMTGMYNVLEKLRSGQPLDGKEQAIHHQGLVSVLRQIHGDLDATVFDAYGWPHDLSDEAILERVVALNHERAEEEKRGLIRWLRPEYQQPLFAKPAQQQKLGLEEEPPAEPSAPEAVAPQPWPKTMRDQVREVRGSQTSGFPFVHRGDA
jgi:hypothetical protein